MIPIDITESEVFAAVRAFLLTLVTDTEVVKGQDNRVPEPDGGNFITMIPVLRESPFRNIATFVDCLFDGELVGDRLTATNLQYGTIKVGSVVFGVDVLPNTQVIAITSATEFVVDKPQDVSSRPMAAGVKSLYTPVKMTIQLDVHGSNSANACEVITTAFRDQYAADTFALSGQNIFPLYASDPKQMAFRNSEQQIEGRWVVDLVVQYNAVFAIPQQFFDQTTITLTEVDTL